MKSKYLVTVGLSLVVISLILSYSYYSEDFASFESAVNESSGNYFETDFGKTRYKVYGVEGNPTVIMIHSFNGFIESWAPNVEPIVSAGYRVVVYDLWGRGLSARPRIDLNLEVFRGQLEALVEHLELERFYLVGSSFGCVIATDFALKNPSKVDRLALIGPAGWPSEENGVSSLISVPILGDLAFHYFGERLLLPKVEAYLHDKQANLWAIEKWQEFAAYPGFTRSALSTLRHSPVVDYTGGWKKLGILGKPTMFVWGELDVSFPFASSERAKTLIPHAHIIGVKNAAHWVNIEKASIVNEAVISFFSD